MTEVQRLLILHRTATSLMDRAWVKFRILTETTDPLDTRRSEALNVATRADKLETRLWRRIMRTATSDYIAGRPPYDAK